MFMDVAALQNLCEIPFLHIAANSVNIYLNNFSLQSKALAIAFTCRRSYKIDNDIKYVLNHRSKQPTITFSMFCQRWQSNLLLFFYFPKVEN